MLAQTSEFKEIVRILGTNLDGNRLLIHGITGIRGLGIRLSQAIVRVLNLDPRLRTGYLTDQQIEKIEDVAKNPTKYSIPLWMLNRRKDFRTGEDKHIVASDLAYINKMDIDRHRRIKSWKGIRHALNLKVRGQRTRCTGRSGLVLGVARKKQA